MGYFSKEFRSVIYVDDYEACKRFYGDGLELTSGYSWDDGPDDRGIKYDIGGGMLEVIRRDPPQELKKKTYLQFIAELADRPYGIRCFRLLDPNRNDVVIFSYLDRLPR